MRDIKKDNSKEEINTYKDELPQQPCQIMQQTLNDCNSALQTIQAVNNSIVTTAIIINSIL
jgi:hypothetical protein